MKLVNTTPVPADLRIGAYGDDGLRLGALIAKATFRIVDGRYVELETQDPMPLLFMDEETDLGLLPRDDLVRQDDAFEVILLGAAYAPGGRPVPAVMVSLSLGDIRRDLLVVGDRTWEQHFGRFTMSQPEPFTRMPMTWSRAFGGTAVVQIDREALIDVSDPRNREGKGFDPLPSAERIAEALAMPRGYPVVEAVRPLPNLEDPDRRISSPDEAPDPLCWATLPMNAGLHTARILAGLDEATMTSEQLLQQENMLFRAHPEWVIPTPPEGALLTLHNATPGGPLSFRLPSLRVVFDYVNAGRRATRSLAPHMMVLCPEEGRLTITYRKPFTFHAQKGTERGIRLRLERGWYPSTMS